MAAGSLLALLDDITSVLDDVATMTKVAARKTAGVLGDDLALNAEQVSGVRAERELPVVWAVALGSLRNKLILVPAALLISAFAPALITPLLMLGGAYLCFEGAEKLLHSWLGHDEAGAASAEGVPAPATDLNTDLLALEREKIKGAIRTDFVLSAEIIVIALGTIQLMALPSRIAVLSLVALLMTIGVYGLVALIVKLDDMGLWLLQRPGSPSRMLGRGLLWLAPALMRTLAFVGTIAMFMVGGGILLHGLPLGHTLNHAIASLVASWPAATIWQSLAEMLAGAISGVVAGGVLVLLALPLQRLLRRRAG